MLTIAEPSTAALTVGCRALAPECAEVDLLVVGIRTEHEPRSGGLPSWLSAHRLAADRLGEEDAVLVHRTPADPFAAEAVLLVRMDDLTPSGARGAGRLVGAGHDHALSLAIVLDVDAGPTGAQESAGLAMHFTQGFADARYRFHRYRRDPGDRRAELTFLTPPGAHAEALATALRRCQIVEDGVRWARDLTNTPARDLTPALLADEVEREAGPLGLSVTVFDEAQLVAERFGGLCAVGAGSPHPPRLVSVTYQGASADGTPPLVLIGKGITFDSGGLSLKKASDMVEMKSDMAGAATVLGVLRALGSMQPESAHVVGLLPAAENLPGPHALRPGDVIRHRNGLTTEVVNTDCEGRLVLSDTLVYGAELQPSALIDLATLTYSTISALGMEITAVLGTDARLVADLKRAGEETGEQYWELPLWHGYRKHIDSPFADLRNEENGDGAGAITAALYLREFVGDVPWAHLDIGGTAYLDEDAGDLPAGATGWGVRSLVQFILDTQLMA